MPCVNVYPEKFHVYLVLDSSAEEWRDVSIIVRVNGVMYVGDEPKVGHGY